MRSEKEVLISAYLRLAELCSPSEELKKKEYMRKTEELLNDFGKSKNLYRERSDKIPNDTNSVIDFIHSQEKEFHEGKSMNEVYSMYRAYCMDCGIEPESKQLFGRTLRKKFGLESKVKRVGNKTVRFYVKNVCVMRW